MTDQDQAQKDPAPSEGTEDSSPLYSVVTHNFESMNRAIDNQVEKQELMSVIYRTQRYEKATRTLFYIVSTLAIALLTATLIWWLLHSNPEAYRIDFPALENQQALQTLASSEEAKGEDAAFINTSFTVFHRNLTPSGDNVVTGKTFAPEDLATPYEQYCYLESASSTGSLSAIPLASYDEGSYQEETTDPNLLKLIRRYCRFSG